MKQFDFEEWLRKQIDWEDPDTILMFIVTKDNQIAISDYNGNYYATGKMLQEVCEKWSERK